MSWPDGVRYSCPLQSLVVSPFISRIHSCLFSDWILAVSSKQVPSISTKELVLPRLRCNERQLSVKLLSLQDWQNRNPSRSASGHPSQDASHLILTVQLRTLRRSLFGNSLSVRSLVQALGSCPASGAPWSSAMPPSPGGVG